MFDLLTSADEISSADCFFMQNKKIKKDLTINQFCCRINLVAKIKEKYPSGSRGSPGKRVGCESGAGVQIPSSPLLIVKKLPGIISGSFFLFVFFFRLINIINSTSGKICAFRDFVSMPHYQLKIGACRFAQCCIVIFNIDCLMFRQALFDYLPCGICKI